MNTFMMNTFMMKVDIQLIYTIVIQLIVFGILFLALRAILYKPVTEFLQKRRDRIQNDIQDASDKLSNAEVLKAEYEIKLKDIEKERTSILEEARATAKDTQADIIEEARKEAETIKNRATLDIQREEEKAKEDIRLQIVEVSSLVASKFITKNISKDEQNTLIDEAIKDLEGVKWEN